MKRKQISPDELVLVSVCRIVIDEAEDGEHLLFLRETHGEALFPMACGFCEAAAIRRILQERTGTAPTLRPLTHELLLSAIESLRGRVERVIITGLENETFFARIVILSVIDRAAGEEISLDARPSDAISVGLLAGAPLYVLRELLEQITGEP